MAASARKNSVPLALSNRVHPPGARPLNAADPEENIEVTLVLRPACGEDEKQKAVESFVSKLPAARRYLNERSITDFCGASGDDIDAVIKFVKKTNLRIVRHSKSGRYVLLSGKVAEFNNAFSVDILNYSHEGAVYRSHKDKVRIHSSLDGIVVAILGLENRPLMTHHTFVAAHHAAPQVDPAQVAEEYNFPVRADGNGQTIAIIELGGGFHESDMRSYFDVLRLKQPHISVVEMDGQKNNPAAPGSIRKLLDAMGLPLTLKGHPQLKTAAKNDSSNLTPEEIAELQHALWTVETTMDIQLAGAFANAANLVVYFAPNNAQGKFQALTRAINSKENPASVITCSWGATEDSLPRDFVQVFDSVLQDAALRGITVCFSSGDRGSDPGSDGAPRVHFPASSPHVLSCGGTHWLPAEAPLREVVWSETTPHHLVQSGGGVSKVFKLPKWQANAEVRKCTNSSGRGVPDVSGKADIVAGYRMIAGGFDVTMGGTSASAPMWAGLIARLNQELGCNSGYITPLLYMDACSASFRDITEGNNGAFKAGPGWDACTGWGRPDGEKLLASLKTNGPG